MEDELSILHIGDGLKVDGNSSVDILCLPYMRFMTRNAIKLANRINPKYIIPIHFDIPMIIEPEEIRKLVNAEIIIPREFIKL